MLHRILLNATSKLKTCGTSVLVMAFKNPSNNFRKTFHTPEQRTSSTTYRLTAGLNTLESKKEGTDRRRAISEEKQRRRRQNCTGKVWKGKKGDSYKGGQTVPIKTEKLHFIQVWVSVPAEDCPLIFGVHSEPNGLLASPRGDGLCGGRRLCLAFLVIAVWAAGGRAIRCHQWSLSRHTHTPHTCCREWRIRNNLTLMWI